MDFLKKKFDEITGDATAVVKRAELPEVDIVGAIREALDTATQGAVSLVSAANGYYSDLSIRIPIPPQLQKVFDALALLPTGKETVDEFVKTLNAAAEAAAKEAYAIFAPVIKALTIQNALDILNGGQNAATTFFESVTRGVLYERFHPIVLARMRDVGLIDLWEKITILISKLPGFISSVAKPELDFSDFVTNKALDGLFVKLGEKEKDIRDFPQARVTPLMKKVFSAIP